MHNPMDDLLANLFGGGIPFGHMGSFNHQQTPFGRETPFGPNVRVFHNGVSINPNIFMQRQKPSPIIKNISLTLDKILTGTTLPIDIERWLFQDDIKIVEQETLYIDIPKGIDEGEIITLIDKGNIANNDCKGDIKIYIKIDNNTDFTRSGLNLIYNKTITLKEALCGFSFELKYITGKTYTINNNSGNIISPGYNKVIPKMGFTREDHVGNLVIVFNIKFPTTLSPDVLENLKKIDF